MHHLLEKQSLILVPVSQLDPSPPFYLPTNNTPVPDNQLYLLWPLK